jgi:cytoskeletal protein CcmA (bactofilin family)
VWNKNAPNAPTIPAPQPEGQSKPAAKRSSSQVATIGPSITIKGDLLGEEDLIIEGKVEGEVFLHQQNVTIGPSGKVHADVHGKNICIEGEIRGNLVGEEVVIIRQSGKVEGNVTAPRVTLENGANFRGNIDMQPSGKSKKNKAPSLGSGGGKPMPGTKHAAGPR